MKSPNLTVLIYSTKRALSLTDETMFLEIEIPQRFGITRAKMTFAEIDNINSKTISHLEIKDLEGFVSHAKVYLENRLRESYPLNTPMGGEFLFDKEEIDFLDLILNEPDDQCLDEMLMKKNPTETFMPNKPDDDSGNT